MMNNSLTFDGIINKIKSVEYQQFERYTLAILTLENGFKVFGQSACVSMENYNQEKGESTAHTNAVSKIWELEGYLLRQRLYEADLV